MVVSTGDMTNSKGLPAAMIDAAAGIEPRAMSASPPRTDWTARSMPSKTSIDVLNS